MSSVALDTERAGYQAAELLDKLMSGKKLKPKKIMVNPSGIVSRRSSDIFAVEDSQVIEAIKFIYDHVHEPIRTEDVAEAILISRRGLYDKFQRAFNCKVTDYINRVKIEQISRWLIDTDMTVSQIAYKFGFSSPYNVTRYFRKHKDISPLAFRKQNRTLPK
jgi:LacI family transcriptional regulator